MRYLKHPQEVSGYQLGAHSGGRQNMSNPTYFQLIKARLGLDRCMKLVEIAFPGEILNETNRNRS